MKLSPWILGLLSVPVCAAGQIPPAADARVSSLLEVPEVDSLLASLDDRFTQSFLLIVSDFPPDQHALLREAATEAFDPDALRPLIATALERELSPGERDRLVEMLDSGAGAELRREVQRHEPEESFRDFSADAGNIDRERLQLTAALVEARRASELDIFVDEALRKVAHDLVAALGGEVQSYEPLSDEAFDAAYRDRTLTRALESLYRLQPVSRELILAHTAELRGVEAQRFSEGYRDAVVAAVATAGQRLAALTVPADPDPVETEPTDPGSAPPCAIIPCGFQVEWSGREPAESTEAYGAPGDLERFTYQNLVSVGYRLERGPVDGGLTIYLRAQPARARCDEIVTTTNPFCYGVGRVRVEFRGVYPGHETPGAFLVQNRCRARALMPAPGISALVAARIHYELTTFPGDERNVPSC